MTSHPSGEPRTPRGSGMRKRWIGRWLMAIGVLHIALGLFTYRRTFAGMLSSGVWNTLAGHPDRELSFWFVVSGWGLLFGGGLLDRLETADVPLPQWAGWALLAVAGIGILAEPMTGFWALVPPAIGTLRRAGTV